MSSVTVQQTFIRNFMKPGKCYSDDKCNASRETYKNMRGADVEDGLDVAGVDKGLIIFLYLFSNTCITQHYYLD